MNRQGKYIRENKGKAIINKIGIKFNKLTVIKEIGYLHKDNSKDKKIFWLCKCNCGNEIIIAGCKIGRQKSCGCIKKLNSSKYLHGESKIRKGEVSEYRTWLKIKSRCNRVNDPKYSRYGGRGIKVCDRWNFNYENFLEDMGRRPDNKSSIDRINVDENYCPENCRWSDSIEQANNKTNSRYYEYNNEKLTIAQWSRKLELPYPNLRRKLVEKNESLETIINTLKLKL